MPRPRTPAEAAAAVPGATVQPAVDTIPSYMIQPGQTPKQVEMRRRMAQSLMEQGTSTAPLQGGGWIEAAARPLTAFIAGAGEYGAAEEEKRGQRSAAQALSQALTGEKIKPQQLASFVGHPWATPGEQSIMASVYEQQNKPQDPLIVPKGASVLQDGQWVTPGGAAASQIEPDDMMKFRKDLASRPGMTAWGVVQPKLASMRAALDVPEGKSPRADDLDFVYGVASILDPNSVVRDSEGRMILNTQGLPDQLVGQYNMLMSGKSGLGTKVKRELYALASRRAGAIYKQAQSEYESALKFGGQFGMRSEFYDPLTGMPPDMPPSADPNIRGDF